MTLHLRTVKGTPLEVDLPHDCVSIGQLRRLLTGQYYYPPSVKLMYAGKMLGDEYRLTQFPDNTLLVVGEPNRPAEPFAVPTRTANGHHPAAPHEGAKAPIKVTLSSKEPQRPPQTSSTMNLSIVHPRAQHTINVTLSTDATVDDLVIHLVAKDPRLVGCKIVYAGRLLTDVTKRLHEFGVHDKCTLHLAAVEGGGSASPQSPPPAQHPQEPPRAPSVSPRKAAQTPPPTQSPRDTSAVAILDKLAAKLTELRTQAATDGSEKQRKLLYEASMRVLLETDGLVDLSEALRERRRGFVREVTSFQDSLHG